jgi:uroporphyrin-III C-methyltransferase/precorrin-2 dehydrogenase/sirohydrochlorin ferrochelatase
VDYLPLFAAIKEKPVLVVGTGEIADRKIAFLQRAGAQVRVVAEADLTNHKSTASCW